MTCRGLVGGAVVITSGSLVQSQRWEKKELMIRLRTGGILIAVW